MSRDKIRKAILNAKPKSKIVTVFGVEVEIRQAKVGAVLKDSNTDEKMDRATAFVNLLIQFCYEPGTNNRVFDETDIETLKELPLGSELTALQTAVNELMGLNVEVERKNLEETTSGTT